MVLDYVKLVLLFYGFSVFCCVGFVGSCRVIFYKNYEIKYRCVFYI